MEADLATVLTLLQQDSLNVDSEFSLLSACLRWGQKRTYDWADLRELLSPVLELIRLRTLTTLEFSNSIYPLGLFSNHEKLEIIISILNRGHTMPLGLCNTSRPRMDVEEITNVATPKAVVLSRHALDELRIEYKTLGTRTRIQCYLDLTPSEDILVYGVEIKALDDTDESQGDTYEEKITLAMVKVRDIMVSAQFKGFVKYGSKFKIFFTEPCLVTKGSQFYIRTTYENSKVVRHPNFSYLGHACNVKGVEFKFHPNIDQESHITCVYFKREQDI